MFGETLGASLFWPPPDTLMKMLTCQDKEVKTKFLNKCIESL